MSDLSNYGELISYIGDLLDRDDLADRVPTFVRLTEARLNRLLSDPNMEVVFTTTATGNSTPLPTDYGEMVSVSTGDGALAAAGPVEFATYRTDITGSPRHYAIVDGEIFFAPVNATTPVTLIYRRRIPALTTDNPTNWLLTLAPDVYLYGALVQAEAFLVEDDRLPLWKAAFDEAIDELRIDGDRRKWGAGPIAPRVNRP